MTQIQRTGGQTVNWSAMLNALDGEISTKGTEQSRGPENLVFSEGNERAGLDIRPSDLEAPQSKEGDSGLLADLLDKLVAGKPFDFSGSDLKAFTDTFKLTILTAKGTQGTQGTQGAEGTQETKGTEGTEQKPATSTKTVLFDIYQMMALLTECAQKLKDAQREQRKAENEALITSIKNQADAQRSAALTGMIAGGLVCVLQVAASGYAAYKSVANAKTDSALSTEFGVKDAATELGAAQSQLDTDMSALKTFNTEHPLPAEGADPEPAEITQQRTQLQEKVTQSKAQLGQKRMAFEADSTAMKHSDGYYELQKSQAMTRALSDISMAVGNLGQTVVRGFVDTKQAEATAMGADQKKAEEGLAEAKELMDNFQQLIEKVTQLMQAIIQAENQSMSDAIHA